MKIEPFGIFSTRGRHAAGDMICDGLGNAYEVEEASTPNQYGEHDTSARLVKVHQDGKPLDPKLQNHIQRNYR